MALINDLPNIKTLVTLARGEITLGAVAGLECVATASDEDQCLAMLVKGDDETIDHLLRRLDHAIEQAQEHACLIDELNTNR